MKEAGTDNKKNNDMNNKADNINESRSDNKMNDNKVSNNQINGSGNNNKRHPILLITTICVVAAAIIGGVISYIQIGRYEKGILEVCATQQDSYVQLVLDQINLKDNRDDEEIINDILKTMDSSSNKYWAFSKNQSMLFVKDVLETNRYKGVSADTYYNSRESSDFMDSLTLNRVAHKIINLDNKTYLVSGVLFKYAGQDYRLCLMTEKTVLLDNNTYLEIKVQMETFIVVLLMALVLVTTIYAFIIRKQAVKIDGMDSDIRDLCRRLSSVNDRLMDKDLHDTRNNVWKQKAIVPFIDKLMEKECFPLTFAQIECDDNNSRKKFLERAVYILDRNVLRFEYGASDIVLIAVGITTAQLNHGLDILKDDGIIIQRVMLIDNKTDMQKLKDRYM